MFKWMDCLGEGYHRLSGTWCEKHSSGYRMLGCPACVREKLDEWERCNKRQLTEIAGSEQMIAVVAMDNTLKAVRVMMKKAKNMEDLGDMLDSFAAFRNRS